MGTVKRSPTVYIVCVCIQSVIGLLLSVCMYVESQEETAHNSGAPMEC